LEAVLPRAAEILADVVQGKAEPGHTACVIAPNRALRDQVRRYFVDCGVGVHTIEANERDPKDSSTLRFSTMHRAKGLEFDQVVVLAQKASLEGENADQSRKLVYVALTRAKRMAALLRF
jgi:DNA helicase IV